MSSLQINPTEPTSGSVSRGLTPERIKLLAACVVRGCTRLEMHEELGVSVRTVSRWKTDPRVLAEVERLRNRTIQERAEDTLVQLCYSGDERIALRAAQTLWHKPERPPTEPRVAAVQIVLPEGHEFPVYDEMDAERENFSD